MMFHADLVRVYFNRAREDKKKIWSLDTGPGTVEILASSIRMGGGGLVGTTCYDPTHESVKAWIEFRHVLVVGQNDDTLQVTSKIDLR